MTFKIFLFLGVLSSQAFATNYLCARDGGGTLTAIVAGTKSFIELDNDPPLSAVVQILNANLESALENVCPTRPSRKHSATW